MNPYRQKGMAVIGALIVVAAASVATASIMERQSVLADTLASERDRAQARWLLRGALDWARVILLSDARNNAVTLKNAVWAQPIANLLVQTPGNSRSALVSGMIEDEQGKYNLQQLAQAGIIQAGEVARLERLLSHLGLPERLAMPIAERVAASQTRPDGLPTAVALRSVHDLRGLAGLTREQTAFLSEYLTLLPQRTPLNVNTASAEVLSAWIPGLDLAAARQMVEERERGMWFNGRGDFLNRLNDPRMAKDLLIDVRSDWFKVTGSVSLDHAVSTMQALIHRTGDAAPTIRWLEG